MSHSLITFTIPFDDARADEVENFLASLGNPANVAIRDNLDATNLVHFMSMNVVRGDAHTHAHLLIELSVDYSAAEALERIEAAVGAQLRELLNIAGVARDSGPLRKFLARYQRDTGQGWFSAATGLDYDGTPEMSVGRIKREAVLARRASVILDAAPGPGSALQKLAHVRRTLWENEADKWAFIPEPAPFLAGNPTILTCVKAVPRIVASAIATLLWPCLLIAAIAFVAMWYVRGVPTAVRVTTVVWVTTVVFTAPLIIAYLRLRRHEKSDIADAENPSADIVGKIMPRENHSAQNHLFDVSTVKAGALRRFTLRIGLWTVREGATQCGRPSFLAGIGSIHFARWVLIPGTDKLVFLSNYDGAWESYLEDFIEKAHAGMTGIWSNTVGFPKTNNLYLGGAADGDRLKRWGRRQQRPTLFWYAAYPELTLSRIRINAAIRQGIALAATEAEAADWVACFGSAPRPAGSLETLEIPTLAFGPLPRLTHATFLALRLPDDTARCKSWLSQIRGSISHGDSLSRHEALVVAFSRTGLCKLGMDQSQIATFPVAFQHGMAARANALRDIDRNAPEHWSWGGRADSTADAVMLLYAADSGRLASSEDARRAELNASGLKVVRRIELRPLDRSRPVREAFGFIDGISQPIVRGTRRATVEKDAHQVVEPGEIVLGYPDNRGYMPSSPTVAASNDPANVLPAADPDLLRQRPNFAQVQSSGQHDIGRNSTFLVVRQLAQDPHGFEAFLEQSAKSLATDARVAHVQPRHLQEWIAAKLTGRWRIDGTSLVRNPHGPGTGHYGATVSPKPDNEFLFGADDPAGLQCPFGAHIRRANPRDSFEPGSMQQLAITNRHRILRVGRSYEAQGEERDPGLLFMCINADIERQFEFVQQTWALDPSFHGLENEVDPVLGPRSTSGIFTIPTPDGPLYLQGLRKFVTVRGGGYFFLPGRKAIEFLSR